MVRKTILEEVYLNIIIADFIDAWHNIIDWKFSLCSCLRWHWWSQRKTRTYGNILRSNRLLLLMASVVINITRVFLNWIGTIHEFSIPLNDYCNNYNIFRKLADIESDKSWLTAIVIVVNYCDSKVSFTELYRFFHLLEQDWKKLKFGWKIENNWRRPLKWKSVFSI